MHEPPHDKSPSMTSCIQISSSLFRVYKTIQSGNWEVPLNLFIAQTSDPIYWSVIATVLMKTIFEKLKSEKKSQMTEQDQDIIQKKIIELDKLSYDFISTAYNIDQEETVEFLKQARIGGYSIIGEFCNGAMQHVELQMIIF